MSLRESRSRDLVTASPPALWVPSTLLGVHLGTGGAEPSSDNKQSCHKERLPGPQELGKEADLWKGPSAFNSPLHILHMRKVRPREDTDVTKVTQ